MSQFTIEVLGAGLPWMNKRVQIKPDGSWLYLGGSFGVRLYETAPYVYALRCENGAVGRDAPGGFFMDKIILRCPSFVSAPPRINHAATWTSDGAYSYQIGNGNEYIQPRAIFTRRFCLVPWYRRLWDTVTGWFKDNAEPWRAIYNIRPKVRSHEHLALPRALAPRKSIYDEKGEMILLALKTGIPNAALELYEQCGMFMPMGLRDPGSVGGGGIEPHPGHELSSLWRILCHDLTMERCPVSYVDATTGAPITTQRPEYRPTRGWNVSTQLAEFARPLTQYPTEDQRIPLDLNTGFCSYRNKFVPSDTKDGFYDQRYSAYDSEHLVRATRHAKCAAILYGDPVADHDLEQIAADAWVGTFLLPDSAPANVGTDAYGRGLAWTMNAMQACGADWAYIASQTIAGALLRVQDTETGSYQAFVSTVNYGHSPSPFAMPPQYGASIPLDLRAAHTLEVAYLAMGVELAGYHRSAERAANFIGQTQPLQWIALTPPASERIQTGNAESYSCWCLWAVLGWKTQMQNFLPPGAQSLAGPNVHAALLAAGSYEASARAIELVQP